MKKIKRIGVITSMEMEAIFIKNDLQIINTKEKAGGTYTLGSYNGLEIIVGTCGMGKVNAAVGTQLIINDYQVDMVINTGISGSVDDGLKIGDVVISTDFVYHDVDFTFSGGKPGQVMGLKVDFFTADQDLLKTALNIPQDAGFAIHSGRIATGDQIISDKVKARDIRERFGAYAVDMEGAAVAHVCYLNNMPVISLRGISDDGDLTTAKMDANQWRNLIFSAIRNVSQVFSDFVKNLPVLP